MQGASVWCILCKPLLAPAPRCVSSQCAAQTPAERPTAVVSISSSHGLHGVTHTTHTRAGPQSLQGDALLEHRMPLCLDAQLYCKAGDLLAVRVLPGAVHVVLPVAVQLLCAHVCMLQYGAVNCAKSADVRGLDHAHVWLERLGFYCQLLALIRSRLRLNQGAWRGLSHMSTEAHMQSTQSLLLCALQAVAASIMQTQGGSQSSYIDYDTLTPLMANSGFQHALGES